MQLDQNEKTHFLPFLCLFVCVVCVASIGRHSDSIDVSRFRCGRCSGVLLRLGRFNPDGTPAKSRSATGFALYVKEAYGAAKVEHPNTPHRELMKIIAATWSEKKATQQQHNGTDKKMNQANEMDPHSYQLEHDMRRLNFNDDEIDE